ncbi:hypothetical protein T484DRAFT_1921515 [Baffinella frigidus]|nr:hypothetical protein T484DRAFT_1921515 [Cryptophyta sp. CCMP2293]
MDRDPYMSALVIENSQVDEYFTEKIIDCLLTGTVPIYWGAPSTLQHFDRDGIIFLQGEDLPGATTRALQSLDPALYQQMLPAVRRNFEKAQRFIDPLGWIWTHHLDAIVRERREAANENGGSDRIRGHDHVLGTHKGRDHDLGTEKGRDHDLDTHNGRDQDVDTHTGREHVLDTHPGREADTPGGDVLGAWRGDMMEFVVVVAAGKATEEEVVRCVRSVMEQTFSGLLSALVMVEAGEAGERQVPLVRCVRSVMEPSFSGLLSALVMVEAGQPGQRQVLP